MLVDSKPNESKAKLEDINSECKLYNKNIENNIALYHN